MAGFILKAFWRIIDWVTFNLIFVIKIAWKIMKLWKITMKKLLGKINKKVKFLHKNNLHFSFTIFYEVGEWYLIHWNNKEKTRDKFKLFLQIKRNSIDLKETSLQDQRKLFSDNFVTFLWVISSLRNFSLLHGISINFQFPFLGVLRNFSWISRLSIDFGGKFEIVESLMNKTV